MDSRSDLEILLGLEPGQDFADWDTLKELDRREKRMKRNRGRPMSAARKEANKRAHKRSVAAKAWNQQYHHEVVSPRRKAVREWMKEHPEEVKEIETRRM